MKHIAALDGIRGIAILFVMLFHLSVPGFSLGWSGVPLFFVLSGFLITSILLEEKNNNLRDYLRSFYVKRTLRIFPLFYAYLLVNFIVLMLTGRSTDGYGWYLLYLQNYHIGLELNSTANIPGIVGHTWSLAVEEQFYLIWPFVVYFLSKRQLAWACAVLIISSPIARWAILQNSGNVFMTNVTLPSCLDMMSYGALLAVIRSSRLGERLVYALFAIGSAMVAYAVVQLGFNAFWEPQDWTRPAFYLYTALAFVFGMVIWSATTIQNKRLVKLLSVRPLLFTGKISYGLYIWHYAIFLAVEKVAAHVAILQNPLVVPMLSIGLAYLVAAASFFLFEIHFLRLKNRFARRSTVSNSSD